MNPKITIVTPSFNRVWAISSCLDSVRAQIGIDYEHIIMDGGSTDGTLEYLLAEAAKDSRLRVISEPDSGMYDAVNKGMKIALGNIVAYLNTDDFYLPGALAAVLSAFEQTPSLCMLYGHWMSWYPEHEFLEILPVQCFGPADLADFAVLPQPSVFFRRSVFEQLGGFDLSYNLLSDNEFFSRVAVDNFPFKRLDVFLSVQTVHSGNLLAGNPAAILQAKQEGKRYRHYRRQELSANSPRGAFFPIFRARVKRWTLPVTWRAQLLIRLWLGALCKDNQTRAPWRYIEGSWSIVELLRYMFSRAPRQRYSFFYVTESGFSAFLGFSVPAVSGAANSASSVLQ